MKHERKFREREYEEDRRRHKHGRGHQGRGGASRGEGELWADMLSDPEYIPPADPAPRPARDQAARPRTPASGTPFQFNEEATIEIKGYKIDLSRVDSVTKEDTVYKGRNSYGITFAFSGKKGLSRTMWYGGNQRQRDSEYLTYYARWLEHKGK